MFVQFRPWLACDRHCPFCYLNEKDRSMSIADRKASLLKLSRVIHADAKDADTIGLIGGELFDTDELYQEWFCLAETIHQLRHIKRIFIASHLLGDVDTLLDFAYMLKDADVQICTSYDTEGRFKDEAEYQKWLSNIKYVQKEGFKVVVSTTLTDAFMHDDKFQIPGGVDFKLQPFFVSEEWLDDVAKRVTNPADYNAELCLNRPGLPKREDVLEWFKEHPDIAKDYARYDDKHAVRLFDYVNGAYDQKDFTPSTYISECGHPFLARCYADSCECTMCDAKRVTDQ